MRAENSESTYEVSVSLRIWHPRLSCGELSQVLGLETSLCKEVGVRRETPKGQILEGVNVETYWAHEFRFDESSDVEACITEVTQALELRKGFLRELASGGGRGDLFIGMFLNENSGIELSADKLREIADMGLTLGFDIYLPEREAGGGG